MGEAARAPMLLRDNFAGFRLETGANLATPGAVFENFTRPARLLDGRDVSPRLVIARAVSMVERIENADSGTSGCVQNRLHMWDTTVGLRNSLYTRPYLAAFRNEIVIGIDNN